VVHSKTEYEEIKADAKQLLDDTKDLTGEYDANVRTTTLVE
jgi:hypothetical protein